MRDGIRVNTVVDSVAELTLYMYHLGSEPRVASKAAQQKRAKQNLVVPVCPRTPSAQGCEVGSIATVAHYGTARRG
eukprot:2948150-Heterocapsa_arctica.AAC.1